MTLRFGISGLEFGTKHQLTSKESTGTILSLAPSVGGFVFGAPTSGTQSSGAGSIYLNVPLLIGIPFGKGHQVVFAPKLHDWYVFESGGAGANVLSAGTSVGLALKIGTLRVVPEITVLYPIAGAILEGRSGVGATRDPRIQAGVAFLRGG